MDSQLQTLTKIFNENLFRIPDYQRGYAWGVEQLNDFWSDLMQIEHDGNHYTGVLTVERVPENIWRTWQDDLWIIEGRKYQPFYIVDGQQRLTTSIVLLQCILEATPDGATLNFFEKKEIQTKFVYISKDSGPSRSYIFGYETDNPSYEYLKTEIFGENSSSKLGQKTVYTKNLLFAKHFFSTKIESLSTQELEVLFRKVTQHLLFNTFTISRDVEVCVAFETMNNRGKPLSHLELLKNRLIYLTTKLTCSDADKSKSRRIVNDCWKSIYYYLGKNSESSLDDDTFLQAHYLHYFPHKLSESTVSPRPSRYPIDFSTDILSKRFVTKNILSESDEKIDVDDISEYAQSLQDAVQIWYQMHNPTESEFSPLERMWLSRLRRMGLSHYRPTVLALLVRSTEVNRRVELLRAIERNLFVTSLAGYHHLVTYPDFDFFHHSYVTKSPNETWDIETYLSEIEQLSNHILSDVVQLGHSALYQRSDSFYGWSHLRYFLFEYEEHLRLASKSEVLKVDWQSISTQSDQKTVTVEHIFPKSVRNQYWKERFDGFGSDQRKSLRNSLGNLLLLSRPKNSSLSNSPFPVKRVSGKKGSRVGYAIGSYSENEVALVEDWGPKEILERGLRLLTFMEDRWNLKLGDTDAKVRFLDLDFLDEKGNRLSTKGVKRRRLNI